MAAKFYVIGDNAGNLMREEAGKPLMFLNEDAKWADGTGLLELYLQPGGEYKAVPVTPEEALAWYKERFGTDLPA